MICIIQNVGPVEQERLQKYLQILKEYNFQSLDFNSGPFWWCGDLHGQIELSDKTDFFTLQEKLNVPLVWRIDEDIDILILDGHLD